MDRVTKSSPIAQRRAFVAAINSFVGRYVTCGEIRSTFAYYGGIHSFHSLLDNVLENNPDKVEVIYDRVSGSYTRVYFHIKKEIMNNR
jgi:hypothetical protein